MKYPTRAVPLGEHPATLPETDIPNSVDTASITLTALHTLQDLSLDDLADNAIWRDTFALTGTLRTFFRPVLIVKVWKNLTQMHKLCNLAIAPEQSRVARYGPNNSWVEAEFSFDIQGQRPAKCSGILGLVNQGDPAHDSTRWKIWMLSTTLERPDGFPDVDRLEPIADRTHINGHTRSNENSHCEAPLDCAVIGGGQAGLFMAGRLEALGLSYIVIDKNADVGHVWVNDRYESVKLHTTKAYNQPPGQPRTFRPEDPKLLSGKDLQQGYQRYIDMFGINILKSTTLSAGSYDKDSGIWTLSLHADGDQRTIKARHIVMATGNNGTVPNMPSYPNKDFYKGDILHGLTWKNARPWAGKSGIVIGSANTAHDVISDMARAGFKSVTMVQRSPTFLLPLATWKTLVEPIYNEEIPTEVSDRMLFGYPMPIQRLVTLNGVRMCADQQTEYFERIEVNGFKAIRYGDLWGLLYDKEGGHFFDVGGGEYIANGSVKVKSDAMPESYTETGLKFTDGSEIEADVIVFATGYHGNMRNTAAKLFGEEVGNSLQEFWQCDEEGEARGAWRDTGHPGLWYTGHGFAHMRYFSRFLAMRIKADVDGKPMEQYMETPVV